MNATKYKWQQCGDNNSFVYALNDKGVNDFCFVVQAGNKPEKEKEIATLACAAPQLLEALEDLMAIAKESRGIAGYHLNGAIADWDEFEFYDKARAAIAAAKGEV